MRTDSLPGRSDAMVRDTIVEGIHFEVGKYRHTVRPERGDWQFQYVSPGSGKRGVRCMDPPATPAARPKSRYPVRVRRASPLGVRRTSRVDPECP